RRAPRRAARPPGWRTAPAQPALRGDGARSVSALLAGAGVYELVVELEGLEPRADPRFLVGMAAEMAHFVGRGRQNGVLELVLSGAFELDVVAVVRTVVGHHGHERALLHVGAAGLLDFVPDHQVWHPFAFGKAGGVVGRGVDIG